MEDKDLGTTWHEFVDVSLPDRWITRVAVDPLDEMTVYATLSGYRAGETASHVFKTTDGGETCQDISGYLPDAPVNDIVVDHNASVVIVGEDVGVYYLKNGKKNWKRWAWGCRPSRSWISGFASPPTCTPCMCRLYGPGCSRLTSTSISGPPRPSQTLCRGGYCEAR
jgi:hypothetical protein